MSDDPAQSTLTVHPWLERRVRTEAGAFLTVPDGWALLPPGDAGLTRRVKAAGPTWTMVEKKGRKVFSRGLWAPAGAIDRARADLAAERATPEYARKLARAAERRGEEQREYALEFEAEVRSFLRFAEPFRDLEARLSAAIAAHATPVGSGTVARTERIPIERRAEAATIAWLRHATTGYDEMRIERVKGARREARRALAQEARKLLDAHRSKAATPHGPADCRLCAAVLAPR